MDWYDALYGNDLSTDNIFGREDLMPRHTPVLHVYLAAGGRLSDYPRAAALRTGPGPGVSPGNSA